MPYKYDKDGYPVYSPLVGRIYRNGEKREWDWIDFLGNSFGVVVIGAVGLSITVLWLLALGWVIVEVFLG